MEQLTTIQRLNNDKDEKIRKLESKIEDLGKRLPPSPDKKRKLVRNKGSSTDGEYTTPRSESHRREKPAQVGHGAIQKTNPSPGGQVTRHSINPSPDGQVTGPNPNRRFTPQNPNQTPEIETTSGGPGSEKYMLTSDMEK